MAAASSQVMRRTSSTETGRPLARDKVFTGDAELGRPTRNPGMLHEAAFMPGHEIDGLVEARLNHTHCYSSALSVMEAEAPM